MAKSKKRQQQIAADNPVAAARVDELERQAAKTRPQAPTRSRHVVKKKSALRAQLGDYPAVDVLERRLLNPFGIPSEPIRLQNQPYPMELRWINKGIPNRYHEVTRYGGYVPVKASELADRNEVSDLVESPDGFVTRGERGEEVLMKMPKAAYDAIQKKRAEIETRNLRDSHRVKRNLVEAAASQDHTFKYRDPNGDEREVTMSGDEAAAIGAQFFGEVNSFRERIEFQEQPGGAAE